MYKGVVAPPVQNASASGLFFTTPQRDAPLLSSRPESTVAPAPLRRLLYRVVLYCTVAAAERERESRRWNAIKAVQVVAVGPASASKQPSKAVKTSESKHFFFASLFGFVRFSSQP